MPHPEHRGIVMIVTGGEYNYKSIDTWAIDFLAIPINQ
jgi:hypothetical protein